MLIRTLATTSATPFRPASSVSRYACASVRAQRHFIFAQRYRRRPAPDHVEIVCKASCARRPFLFSRLSPLPLSLLFCYPFRPSTLVIYRGYAADVRGGICTTGDKKKKKKKRRSGCPRIRNTIVSPRSSGLHLRHSASRSDAMKRSHGSMQRKCPSTRYIDFRARRSNGFQWALAERLK